MDIGTLRGLLTAILLLLFVGIVIRSYSGKRRQDFERAARLPLDDRPPAAGGPPDDREEHRS